MQKTSNFNLKKPESSDPLRVADFNENSDLIDAALSGLNTAVGSKAEQSAVTALQTALGGKGNCKIAADSYTGTGAYGKADPIVLNFDFCPVLVIVVCELDRVVLVRNVTEAAHTDISSSDSDLTVAWGERSVSYWNEEQQNYHMNTIGDVYHYVAVGY